MVDQTIALGIKPPNIDVATPLKAAADINLMRAQEKNTIAETARREFDLQSEDVARGAKSLLEHPEGSPERREAGKKLLDEYKRKGYMNNLEYLAASNHPLDDHSLNRIITRNTPVATSAEITGEAAQSQEAGRRKGAAPYVTDRTGPGETVFRPNQMEGAPPTVPTTVGKFGPQTAPQQSYLPNQNPVGSPLAPRPVQTVAAPPFTGMGGTPPVPSSRAPGAAPAAPATTPTAASGPAPVTPPVSPPTPTNPKLGGKNVMFDEVPRLEPSNIPKEPGIVIKGKTPAEITSENHAVETAGKEIREPGMAAQQQRAGFGTLRSTLESGFNTSRATPALSTLSAWMYAAGMEPSAIKSWTGVDPSRKEIFDKESTQDAMKFVKDTIGSRESLMAINAVRSAFPNQTNTKEANLALVDIMDQAAKWKQDRMNYYTQFQRKNQDVPKDRVLDEFNTWWNQSHPLEGYMSKVVPWQLPIENGKVNADKLQSGVTYQTWISKDDAGKSITPRPGPQYRWNAETGKMDMVKGAPIPANAPGK